MEHEATGRGRESSATDREQFGVSLRYDTFSINIIVF